MAATKTAWQKALSLAKKHPLVRGMASYSLIWPMGSLIQQTIEGRETFDWMRALRFSIYGTCYVAPTLTIWLTIARHMWPQATLSAALAKVTLEQISYTPFAMASFYFGMTLLEGKGLSDASAEVSEKLLPTYKVGVLVWPVIQTFNYTLVPEKNRVVFVSIFSIFWTSFLAYMKHLQGTHFKDTPHSKHLLGATLDRPSLQRLQALIPLTNKQTNS